MLITIVLSIIAFKSNWLVLEDSQATLSLATSISVVLRSAYKSSLVRLFEEILTSHLLFVAFSWVVALFGGSEFCIFGDIALASSHLTLPRFQILASQNCGLFCCKVPKCW